MDKYIITVLGKDQPGIISQITNILYELDCNLENANQMILQDQFAGFFIFTPPGDLPMSKLSKTINARIENQGLNVHIDTVSDNGTLFDHTASESFLITTIGLDQKGLVARFSKILADSNVNIENLKAVFKGGTDPNANIMSYQVSIKPETDTARLFKQLRKKADELDLDIRIQHKNIFDTINKI